jgi:hypothetical protein
VGHQNVPAEEEDFSSLATFRREIRFWEETGSALTRMAKRGEAGAEWKRSGN